ncbi:MAG: CBS domain-containing protein [Thiogranum sp.]|nr:CBS domain-containing protein [Thiogranum sp.]
MEFDSELKVGSIMQRKVLSVEEQWPLHRLACFLTDNQISGAPVTGENDKLVGVVSLTDIVRYDSFPESEENLRRPHEYYLHNLESHVAPEEAANYHVEQDSPATVKNIMTPMVFEISEKVSIQDAADTMVRGHIHRLLVTRNKEIVGIITALDILNAVRTSGTDRSIDNVA